MRSSVLIAVLLLVPRLYAGVTVDDRTEAKSAVRQVTGLESTTLLPDSTLEDIVNRSVVWTSTDIGGVEANVRFVTVAGQAFYAIPDTVTEVLFATMRTEAGATRSIKAWYPQFFEDLNMGDPNTMQPSEMDIPYAYQVWDDSVQLMNAPVRDADTVILKVYIEHPIDTSDTTNFRFSSDAYTQAALDYACAEALRTVQRYEEAALWDARYEKKKADLFRVFTRRFDVMKRGE